MTGNDNYYFYVLVCPSQGLFKVGHANSIKTKRKADGKLQYSRIYNLTRSYKNLYTPDYAQSVALCCRNQADAKAIEKEFKITFRKWLYTDWSDENPKPEQGTTECYCIEHLEAGMQWIYAKKNNENLKLVPIPEDPQDARNRLIAELFCRDTIRTGEFK